MLYALPVGWTGSSAIVATSGVDGRFRFGPMPAGSYRILIDADGFVSRTSDDLEVASFGELDAGDLVLVRGATIVARLRSASGTLPQGLAVNAQEWKGERFAPFTMFGDRARSQRLAKANWVVRVSDAKGKKLAEELVRVDDEREFEVEIEVP